MPEFENTLAEDLQRLVDAKSDIADAITAKGGTVGEGDGFEEFPQAILNLAGQSGTITPSNIKSQVQQDTIAYDLARLIDAKIDIGNAITAKGGTVGANDGFEEFASDIATIQSSHIYAYHVDPSISSPSNAVTYLEDAVGKTPAKMGTSTFSYGDWADAFFLPKPCVLKFDGTVDYYLDPDDYSKKADGTSATIDISNTTGNVMLEFPKIWIKRVPGSASGERTVYISDTQVDSDYKCFSNINANNQEIDHFYIHAYNGTIDNNNKMRSISGITLTSTQPQTAPYAYVPNYTATQEVTAATSNNLSGSTIWYTDVWADMCLIYDLLYLMGKSLDLQGTYGQGISAGSETAMRAYVTGSLNNRGLFYGDISGTSTAVKVLGIENFWALRYNRIAGLIKDSSNNIKVKMTYGTADGSTTTGYNTTGSGYLTFLTISSSIYGYVSKMTANNVMGYMPSEMNGSSTTYYCDYGYLDKSSSTYYGCLGGYSGHGAYCGFCVILYSGASRSNWYIGGALSCKP